MQDRKMTEQELLQELEQLRQRCAEWESRAAELEEYYQALRKKEERYRSFYENAVEGFFQSTPNGRFLNVNPAFARMMGYDSPEELISAISDIERQYYVNPADRARYVNLLKESGAVENFVCKARCQDGSEIWISNSTQSVYDRDGSILYYEGVVENITKSKEAEAALRESERRLADIIEFLPDATLAIDREGRIIAWNKAIEEMTGFKAADMLGKGDYEYALPFYGKRRPILIDFVSNWDKETEKQYSFIHKFGDVLVTETDVPFVRGQNRILSGRAVPLYDGSGQVSGAIESIRDMTERKAMEEELRKSEEKYRNILENMEEVYFEVDLKGRLTFFNDAACAVLGYPRDELMGKHFKEYTSPETTKRIFLDFQEEYFSGERQEIIDYELITKSGSSRLMQVSSNLLRDQGGASIGFRGLARDVTNSRHLESQLIQAQKLEAVGTLAGGIAHDFNNLLMGIQGYTSLMLLDLAASHPYYEKLRSIEDQVQSGADLTRQLLGFAQGGRYEVKPTNLNEIIKKTSSMFGRTKKEIAIHRKLQKDLWAVEVDQGQMEQVFLNLYVNAWQAMPGGGEIYLETRNVFLSDDEIISYGIQPGLYVQISIVDTGVGMNEKTRERIFDPFFTTKEMGRGTGLGLAMVYGIIKGHGGAINVTSEQGHGTTFTIYLPGSEKNIVVEKTVVTETVKGMETILLIDDEPINLEVSGELLESLGYRVYMAGGGQEGLAIYEEKRDEINLVILDMVMPGISGGETFDRLRESNPDIRVLLCSGYSINGQAQNILDRGCNGFIQKPYKMNDLSQKIRELLDG
ncbi:MAG: PAS domain S-box protein [Deltaproteobacteria bacterium]|nr:PAS domain S-box protein [Deltaproteobacteria bacterium]